MTADEVRMLDNRFSLLFIRGESPVKDLKYDILKHPNVSLTTDGNSRAYIHGATDKAVGTISFMYDYKGDKIGEKTDTSDGKYVLLSEEEIEKSYEGGR